MPSGNERDLSKTRVFLDTSALFAGVGSAAGGARLILKLGEAGAVQVLVSSLVLHEMEKSLLDKAPQMLGALALLLDLSRAEVVPSPSVAAIRQSRSFVTHPGDAEVIAAAQTASVDYFVALDQKHLLNNVPLREALSFPIGTPDDFLVWYRKQYQA